MAVSVVITYSLVYISILVYIRFTKLKYYLEILSTLSKTKLATNQNYLTIIHVTPQHFIVCFNTGILNVKVACNATKLCAVKIATFLIKPHHFCFIKWTCSINNKRSLLRTQSRICHHLKHRRLSVENLLIHKNN